MTPAAHHDWQGLASTVNQTRCACPLSNAQTMYVLSWTGKLCTFRSVYTFHMSYRSGFISFSVVLVLHSCDTYRRTLPQQHTTRTRKKKRKVKRSRFQGTDIKSYVVPNCSKYAFTHKVMCLGYVVEERSRVGEAQYKLSNIIGFLVVCHCGCWDVIF